MLTKKDYAKLAAMMKAQLKHMEIQPGYYIRDSYDIWERIVTGMTCIFRENNPRFDASRFHKACGVIE